MGAGPAVLVTGAAGYVGRLCVAALSKRLDELSALVEEAVSVGSLVRLMQVAGGKARLAEVTLGATSPAIGKHIVDVGFPRGSSIVAIVRAGDVVVPRGDVAFHVGDEVLALVSDDTEAAVTAALIGEPG